MKIILFFKIVSQRGLFLGLLVLTILNLLTRWPVVSVLMEQKVDETLHHFNVIIENVLIKCNYGSVTPFWNKNPKSSNNMIIWYDAIYNIFYFAGTENDAIISYAATQDMFQGNIHKTETKESKKNFLHFIHACFQI